MAQGSDERRRTGRGQSQAGANGAAPADVAAEIRMEEQPFEAALGQLDGIVNALEDGKLPLDEALALFEQGVRLAQYCQRQLDRAELRVERLRASSGISELDGGAEEESPDAGGQRYPFYLEPFETDE